MLAFTLSPTGTTIDSQTQEELRTRVLEILGSGAVGLERPSHDLIQAALLVSLAEDVAVDFGLGRPSIQSSPAAWFFCLQGHPTPEMQQTWLTSWMASKMSLPHQDALHTLEEDHSDSLFLEILYTIRFHAEVADEPVLHTETNKMLFRAPYLEERIGVDELVCPQEVTRAAEVALRSLVEACHVVIELVLNMESGLILAQPSIWFGPAVSYSLSILVKAFVAATAPGNTYGQVLSRGSIRIREAVTNLMVVNLSLLKLDPYMGNWNTTITGSVEWLGTWLDDYEAVIERYEANREKEVAESAIRSLSHNRHF
ncbi:hypothetical protein LCI18_013910 [Fusarium solani-melongenae]|uniref:Uncharacterized protein n=1 Tax=Fusarium solani subsp. cucurbitae TaxID=2747967 RepID=A0ACD3ZP18_FUSSC|nr:hypothetical protein LCI18_013910 [Fusarium solani-melongenae]